MQIESFIIGFMLITFRCIDASVNHLGLNIMDSSYLSDAGFGWDYLEDSSRFPIFNYSFYEGRRTSDGIYNVPDCFVAETVKRTEFTDTSDIIDRSYSYVSKYSSTIRKGGGVGIFGIGIGGSYSKDYKSTMENQQSSKTITTSTKFIDHRYNLKVNSKCALDNKFRLGIQDIVFYIEEGFYDLAKYYTELLVKEYGTHYLKQVKIGGMIYVDNFLSNEYWRKYEMQSTTVRKSASASFLGMVKFSSSSESTTVTEETETYNRNIRKTIVDSLGGKYLPSMTVEDWARTLDNNLVTFDRELEIISTLFTPSNFPNIKLDTLQTIGSYFGDASKLYVNVNARSGCINRRSIMFDPTANYEPGTQSACSETYRFGGTFAETIYCSSYNSLGQCVSSYYPCLETHLQTRNKSCPAGYKARTGFLTKTPRLNLTECYGTEQKEKGDFLFGGIYSEKVVNALTGQKTCPPNFVGFSLFDCNKNTICLSLDANTAIDDAIPFGGFVSTCIPTRRCPNGMVQLFINSYAGCDLYYCTKLDKQKSQPNLIKMPVTAFPREQYLKAQELKKKRSFLDEKY